MASGLQDGDAETTLEKELIKSQDRDDIIGLMTELQQSIRNSSWLDDIQKQQGELKAAKVNLECQDLDLEIVEPMQVGTTKTNRDNQVMDVLSELHGHIKSSDWLSEQNELQKKPPPCDHQKNAPKCAEIELDDQFEIVSFSGVDGDKAAATDPLASMMRELGQSITNSDWLKQNTVQKMAEINPDLIADIFKSRGLENNLDRNSIEKCHDVTD